MKKSLFLLALLVFAFSCKTENEKVNPEIIGDFTFSSKTIKSDTPFNIEYTGTAEIEEAFYVNLVNNKSYPIDLEMVENKAEISVPDSVAAVALHFKVDGMYDNDAYLFNVTNTEGETKPDAEAAKEYYALGNGSSYGLKSTEDNVVSALEKALTQDESLGDSWMSLHYYLAQRIDKVKGQNIIEQYINKISNKENKAEDDYNNLHTLYKAKKDSEAADSIMAIALDQFPKGKLYTTKVMNGFFDLKEFEGQEQYFNDHKDVLLQSQYADYIVQTLARGHYSNGNEELFIEQLELSKDKASAAGLLNSIAWPYAEKGENIEKGLSLSKKSLEMVEQEIENPANKPTYYSINQYKRNLGYSYKMYADTYALLLHKNGNVKEAIDYQIKAVDDGKNPEYNERLIEFLVADNQNKLAFEKSTNFIEEGQSTEKIKEHFKALHDKLGIDGNVNDSLASLEKTAYNNYLEVLKKKMLDDEAPDFTMKNLDGEEVNLAALKGKTVILDFWATWCGPCTASFPGMQKAVDKYKDNDNVEFLFVDTFESGDTRLEDVSKFIENNNYSFNVLIDDIKEGTNQHIVANAYNISGIPTKVIIGPSGKLKFKSVGFGGSNDKLMMEIDAMISLLQP